MFINVFNINIEPLSKRIEDIPLLVDYFSEKICDLYKIKNFQISDNNYLLNYSWPGNVRELRNLVERITILSANESKEKINSMIDDILSRQASSEKEINLLESLSSPLKEAREKFEKEYLTIQLKKNHGNISKTADFIGMERSALHRKLKQLGIKGIN